MAVSNVGKLFSNVIKLKYNLSGTRLIIRQAAEQNFWITFQMEISATFSRIQQLFGRRRNEN